MNGTKSAKTNLKVVTSPSSELAALVDDYVLDQRTRNLSPATIKITKDTLHGQFLPWAAQRKVTAAAELTQGLLDAWQRYLLEEHRTPKGTVLSKESVRSYQRSLRGFVRWATERGDVSGIKVTIPKAPTKMVDVLSREEMLDMEKAATGERDKIIIKLLADTGIRLGELVALRPADLMKTKDGRYIRVKGKGDRERDVPIADPRLFERMLQYSKRPQVKQASSGRLFLTDRKHQGGYSALSGRTIQQMLKFTAERAGIDTEKRRIHPHLFRHSAITWMINNKNMPVEHVRRIVGHADLSLISRVYSHVSPSDLFKSTLDLIRDDEDNRR